MIFDALAFEIYSRGWEIEARLYEGGQGRPRWRVVVNKLDAAENAFTAVGDTAEECLFALLKVV